MELRDVVNPNAEIALGAIPYSPKQVMHLEADIHDINNDTGWIPTTQYKTGIKKIIEGK